LNPRLKKAELFQTIDANLKAIREIAGKEDQMPPSQEDVKKIRQLASQVVDQL
jgi:hypothetical protein